MPDTTAGKLTETFASGTPSSGNETDTADDATIYIGVASKVGGETISANKTDYTLKIQQTGAITDAASNSLASFTVKTSSDGAKPFPASAVLQDQASDDGKVDRIVVTWTENVSAVADNSGPWEISSAADFAGLSEGTVETNSGSAGTNETYYNFTTTTVKTDVGDLNLVYTSDNSITDGANNADSVTLTASSTPVITDSAKPVVTAVDFDKSGGYNLIEITYSEAITFSVDGSNWKGASESSASNANLGAMTAVKTLAGVGTWDGGCDMTTNAAADNTVSLDADAKILTITINGQDAGYFSAGTTGPSTDDTFTPTAAASYLKDTAGNPANTATKAATASTAWDVAVPTVSKTYTLDTDGDGKVDAMDIEFNEEILDASVTIEYFEIDTANDGSHPTVCDNSSTEVTYPDGQTAANDKYYRVSIADGMPSVSTATHYFNCNTAGLRDIAGNRLAVADGLGEENDKAAPVVTAIDILDIGADGLTANGKVDHLEVTFSENIDDSGISNYTAGDDYLPTSLAVANATNYKVDASEPCPNDDEDDEYLCIIFTEGGSYDTDATNKDLTWTGASVTIKDGSANATGDLASGDIDEVDKAAPVAVSAVYKDSNTDGQVDKVEITFSENVTFTYADDDWSIATEGTIVLTDETAGSAATNVITLDALGAANITGGETNPQVTYTNNSNNLNDETNNTANFTITVTDEAAPAVKTAVIKEKTGSVDGKVDYVFMTFSEDLAAEVSDDKANWAVSSASNYGVITETSVMTDDNEDGTPDATNLAEVAYWFVPANVYTAVGDLTVAYTKPGSGAVIKDGTGNETASFTLTASSSPVAITDSASPVPISVSSTRAIIGGQVPSGAIWTIDFSENIVSENLANLDLGAAATSEFVFKYDGTSAADQTKFYEADVGVADPLETGEFSIVSGDLKLTFSDNTNKADEGSVTWTTGAKFNLVTAKIGAEELDDGASNNSAVANDTDIAISGLTDSDPPTISTINTMDDNGDGTLDFVKVVFNESVEDSTFVKAKWTIGNLTVADDLTANPTSEEDTDDDATIYIGVSGGSASDTGYVPDVTTTFVAEQAGGIKDLSGNGLRAVASETVDETDKAKPVLITGVTKDDDTVYVTFSEAIENSGNEITAALSSIKLADNTTAYEDSSTDEANAVSTDGAGDLTSFYLHMTTAGNAWNTAATGSSAGTGTDEGGTTRTNVPAVRIDAAALKDTATSPNTIAATNFTGTTDGAAPTLISVAGDGNPLDAANIQSGETLTFTFSEAVTVTGANLAENDIVATYDGDAAVTTTETAFDGATLTFGGATNTMTILFGADTTSTDDADYAGSVQQGKWNTLATFNLASGITADQIKGTAENIAAVPAASAMTASGFADTTAPTFVSGSSADSDDDGALNTISLIFSEKIVTANWDADDFTTLTVNDGTDDQDFTGDFTDDNIAKDETYGNQINITLDETTNGTGAISLTYNDGGVAEDAIKDETGNQYSNNNPRSPSITDGAKPVALSADINDTDPNGFLDNIIVTFSEDISTSTKDLSDWTVTDNDTTTDLLDGLTNSAIGFATNKMTITLDDTTGTTAAPTYQYVSDGDADTITDGTNAMKDMAVAASATDDVAPAMMTAVPTSQTTINLTFSEALTTSTVEYGDFEIKGTISCGFTAVKTSTNVVTLTTSDAHSWTDLDTSRVYLKSGLTVDDSSSNTNTLTGSASTYVDISTVTKAVSSIKSLTPANAVVAKGQTITYVVTVNYDDGTTGTITSGITWESSDTDVAAAPVAMETTGAAVGTTKITVTHTDTSTTASTTLSVSESTLTSVAVTPATVSVAKGATQQFVATATYSDNNTRIVTAEVIWSVTAGDATIDANGLATATADTGDSTIQAALLGETGTATLTSTGAVLASIAITPATPTITKGSSITFTATGTKTDGSTTNLTATATWTSSNTDVAGVPDTDGKTTGLTVGSTTIKATDVTDPTISGSTVLTVTDASLSSIAISINNPVADDDEVAEGQTLQLKAIGTYSDTNTAGITGQVEWKSDDEDIFVVSGSGLATAVADIAAGGANQTADITATMNGKTSSALTLTATAPALERIIISPATPTLAPGEEEHFTAMGIYSDQSSSEITTGDIWESKNTNVATIVADTGVATAVAVGNADIEAEVGSVSDHVTLTVQTAGGAAVATPTLTLYSQTTGSPARTDSATIGVQVRNDRQAGDPLSTNWYISEDPGNPTLLDTWVAEPTTYTITGSGTDGEKTVYVWVKDSSGNVCQNPGIATINLVKNQHINPASHTNITLTNGEWNILSVPKLVDSFTATGNGISETTLTGLASKLGEGGALYVLEGSSWKVLSALISATPTHSHYGLENPQPLNGYVIKNMSGVNITLSITYQTDPADSAKIFTRSLSAGWNSIGIADPEKALGYDGVNISTDTSDSALALSSAQYIIDYTDNADSGTITYAANKRVRKVGDEATANPINPRETRGYVVFISLADSLGGFQN